MDRPLKPFDIELVLGSGPMDQPCSTEAIQGLDKSRNSWTDPAMPKPSKASTECRGGARLQTNGPTRSSWSWVGDRWTDPAVLKAPQPMASTARVGELETWVCWTNGPILRTPFNVELELGWAGWTDGPTLQC